MTIPRRHILGLMAGTFLSAMAAGGPAPASAQDLHFMAPTHPTWARWLGLETGRELFLTGGDQQVQIASFTEPRRVRLCVTSRPSNVGANHVAARMITENGETVVPVGRCREVEAARITVTPARDMGGRERVKGLYDIVG